MLIFIPLLYAYAAFWSSVLVLRVPIPVPSPAHSTLPHGFFPLLPIVSAVEEINSIINTFPVFPDLVPLATWSAPSPYIDGPLRSPIPPSPDFPTCTPLDWPPLSDFNYLGAGTCDQVVDTGLIIWNGGPSDSSDFPEVLTSMVDRFIPPEDVRYFAALITSGVGFWLVCRLIAIAILRWSKPSSAKVCGHQSHPSSYGPNHHTQVCLAEAEPFKVVSYWRFG